MAGEVVLSKLAVVIAAQTAEFNKSLARSESNFKSFTTNLNKLAVGVGAGFGFAQIFSGLQDAVRSMAEFESKLSTVKAITGATQKEFDQLRASALKLGATTKFTASQVADLQVEFGRVGFSTGEILNATKATLLLATATGEDLAKSADVAGSTVRGFGLDASETGRVVDVMAESFNATALSLENFREAMKYVAPIAAQAGISVEETTALLGTLADAGIRGSQAGTSLRKIITDIGGETGTLSEKLQKLAAKGLTGAEAMSEVGRTAYASLLILANATDKTNKLTKSLENSAGAAQEAADIMSDNLTGDVVKLTSAYDGLIQSAGGSNSVLREFVQTGTAVLNSLNSNNGALGEFISNWLRLITVVPRSVAAAVRGLTGLFDGINNLTQKEVQQALVLFKGLRDKAIAEGDQEAVKRATKSIADLTSMYGLLRDKAVEFNEDNKATTDGILNQVDTYEQLQEKLKQLNSDFVTTDRNDKTKLANIGAEIIKTQNLIAKLDEYRNKQKEINNLRKVDPIAAPSGLLETAKAFNKVQDEAKKANEEIGKFIMSISPVSSLTDKVEAPQWLKNYVASIRKGKEEIQKEIIDIGPLVANAITGLSDALGTAFATGDFRDFGKALLEAVASFAQQLGSLMIASGIGQIALKSGNPVAMIAAGAVLVAAGAAIKSTLGRQKNFPNATAGGSGGSSNVSNGSLTGSGMQIELGGEFTIKGSDLVYIFNRQQQLNSRTGG